MHEVSKTTVLPADVRACAERLGRACGNDLMGVLFFGSRLVNTSPNRHSAADLFVVVESYSRAYRALRATGVVHRAPWLLTATNRILAPNVLRIGSDPDYAGCKCFFISRGDLQRELGHRSRDHFCKGRLTQTVAVVWTRDDSSRDWLESRLRLAREDSLRWVPAYLPKSFDARDYCGRMMAISYRSEIRPESRDRVLEVLEAQGDELVARYDRLLRERGPDHGIETSDGGFRCERPPRRRAAYFTVSRARATLRWLKYLVTFENWLDYIVQKLHRRSGIRVSLSDAERRYPLLLLWPKLVRVLWQLRRQPSGSVGSSTGEEKPQ